MPKSFRPLALVLIPAALVVFGLGYWTFATLPEEVAYCRDELVGTLKAPSSFKLVEWQVHNLPISEETYISDMSVRAPIKYWRGYDSAKQSRYDVMMKRKDAEIGNLKSILKKYHGDGPYHRLVRIEYDAQNSFGATLRDVYSCNFAVLDKEKPVPQSSFSAYKSRKSEDRRREVELGY